MYVLRSLWEMLLGGGWPLWSAKAAKGEPARAKAAPAAVLKKSRRVGVRDFSADILAPVFLEFEVRPAWYFIFTAPWAAKSRSTMVAFSAKVGPLYHSNRKAVKRILSYEAEMVAVSKCWKNGWGIVV